MYRVVVGEFSRRKQIDPVVLLVVESATEVLFKDLVDPVALAIRFRVIS